MAEVPPVSGLQSCNSFSVSDKLYPIGMSSEDGFNDGGDLLLLAATQLGSLFK